MDYSINDDEPLSPLEKKKKIDSYPKWTRECNGKRKPEALLVVNGYQRFGEEIWQYLVRLNARRLRPGWAGR